MGECKYASFQIKAGFTYWDEMSGDEGEGEDKDEEETREKGLEKQVLSGETVGTCTRPCQRKRKGEEEERRAEESRAEERRR